MYKYYSDLPIITDKVNLSVNGIVTVSKELKGFKPVEEIKEEPKTDEKDELIKIAVELGLGAESTLKRNSIETLKKKIEEA